MEIINISKILYYIQRGALSCSEEKFITIKDLYDIGAIPKIKHGLKLLAREKDKVNIPLFIEVSRVSDSAIKLIKENKGQVNGNNRSRLNIEMRQN